MSADVKKKILSRKGHRLNIRKLMSQAKTYLPADGETLENQAKQALESHLRTLLKRQKELTVIDNEISYLLEEDQIEKEVCESLDFDSGIDEVVCLIEGALKISKSEDQPPKDLSNAAESTASSGLSRKVNLPKLTLPHFNGNVADWPAFWDIFESAINSDEELTDVMKFHYLFSLLDGPAKDVVAGLTRTNRNYKEAIDLLHERFGTKQQIISMHVDSLYRLPAVKAASDVAGLRALFDKTEVIVRSLGTVGIDTKFYGIFLIHTLMGKLPEEFRIIITRDLDSDTWTLEQLLEAFKKELRVREKCQVSAAAAEAKVYVRKQAQPSTTSALHVGNKGRFQAKASGPFCTFCQGNHASNSCTKVTDPQVRMKLIKEKGKCFVCLKSGHISRMCQSNIKCFQCQKRHHVALCGAFDKTSSASNPTQANEPPVQPNRGHQNQTSTHVGHVSQNNCILLQTARAKVSSPRNETIASDVRILLDSGAQKTYITDKLAQSLNLPIVGKDKIVIKTFGDDSPVLHSCNIVQLAVQCLDGEMIYINAYSVPFICSPLSGQRIETAVTNYPHLTGLQLADYSDGSEPLEISILLGSDYYWLFVLGLPVRGERNMGPTALCTKFGYVLNGPVEVTGSGEHSYTNFVETHVMKTASDCLTTEEVNDSLKRFWDYESIGIKKEEPPVYETFLKDIKLVDGRYEVSLPFKDGHPPIPDNYSLSEKRLQSLFARLRSKPKLLSQYDGIIREQLDKGIIERVSQDEIDNAKVNEVHYLPHREVIRLDKSTTKLRIVYDASSKRSEEPSLNDCMYTGPPLTPLIFDILLRFRLNGIVLLGDIEKAFLNISIKPEERNLLRFLWVDDANKEEPEIVVYRFTRLVFGLVSSPFVLNATIRSHLSKYAQEDQEFILTVLKSLYVDDFVFSSRSREEALEVYRKLKICFSEAGFNMRKWLSNDADLLEEIERLESSSDPKVSTRKVDEQPEIAEEDESFSKSENRSACSEHESKVLGLSWNKDNDCLYFDFAQTMKSAPANPTKRDILSLTSKLYDPLGLFSPVMVSMKLLFQELCKEKIDWDSPLPDSICAKWRAIVSDLIDLGPIEIDRSVLNADDEEISSIELHGFADASSYAYGATVYLRIRHKSGHVSSSLIASKSRLAPLKGDTIPRLELMSALILARLVSAVSEALKGAVKIDRIVCWLDSQIVLWWIFGLKKEFVQFVENRVREIRKLVNVKDWHYVPTSQNPSDIASRGMKASSLVANRKWWQGPEFLVESDKFWPQILNFENAKEPSSEISDEIKTVLKSNPRKDYSDVFVGATLHLTVNMESIINCKHYSDINRMYRVTAYVLRFVNNLKAKIGKCCAIDQAELQLSEINDSKTLWHRQLQKSLLSERNFDKFQNDLGLFEDEDGILRCRGRIESATLPFGTKHPILLPREHHVTKLIVLEAHENVKHNGLRETLAETRSHYWIVRGRQLVRKYISKCLVCKKLEGLAYSSPSTAPLPDFRVNTSHAFANIGVDFAGPVFVKNIYGSDNVMHKCYIALYTCTVTRAIHLELVPDQSTPAFLRSLKRFQGRRGIPCLVVSDNGSTFKDRNVQNYALGNNIVWRFNVPRASWWGGFFEIMVKLVKRCLKKVIGNAHITYEELETVVIEIEGVLNSRPLAYLYDDISEEPLTPSTLVIGHRLLTQSQFQNVTDLESSKTSLVKRSKYLKQLLQHFWSRFSKEYLPSLREFHRCRSGSTSRVISIGDVVVINKEKVPRQKWNIGKVVKLIPGKDGVVRAAEVKTLNAAGKQVILKRSIVHLYPMEINDECSNSDAIEEDEPTDVNPAENDEVTDVPLRTILDKDIEHHIVNKS